MPRQFSNIQYVICENSELGIDMHTYCEFILPVNTNMLPDGSTKAFLSSWSITETVHFLFLISSKSLFEFNILAAIVATLSLWQYWLWSFKFGDTKIDRLLRKK